jgi:hypothetical protein
VERVRSVWGEATRTSESVARWIEAIGRHLAEIRTTARIRAPSDT